MHQQYRIDSQQAQGVVSAGMHAEFEARQVACLKDNQNMIFSIRAKAMMFNDPRSAALLQQVERMQ